MRVFALLLLLIPLAAQANLRDFLKQRRAGDAHTLVVNGQERHYLVHVPASYDPARPAPLLVAFHGGGGSMDYMAKDQYYGLISKSESAGFIAVFPNGTGALGGDRLSTWNAGRCCGKARDENVDDIAFIRALVAEIERHYNIDKDRIFGAGMSNGGMMQYAIACELSDIFRAVASVAGTDNTASCAPQRPVSILHIHARDDDHVLFDGGAGAGLARHPDAINDFTSVPETISRWTARDHCASPPKRVLNVQGAYCDRYDGCDGGASVQLCVTEDGGHSWPGGNKPAGRAKQPTSKAINADDVMWDFFSLRR